MEREQADQGENKGAGASKRPYRRPEIRRLGSVRELTLTPGGSLPTDNMVPGVTSKTNP
jgi:hypothetical protein